MALNAIRRDPTVRWSADRGEPAAWGRKTPASSERVYNDVSDDVDYDRLGVTISASVWAIHPDDDDAALVLSAPAISGYVTSTLAAGGTDGVNYRLINTITTDDGQIRERTVVLPVAETSAYLA